VYVICKKSTVNLKLTNELIVSPDTSTIYGELCWLTGPQNQEASVQKQRLFVWVLSVTEWSVSHCFTQILIPTNQFRTANKPLLAISIFVSRSPWYPGFRGTQFEKHCSKTLQCTSYVTHCKASHPRSHGRQNPKLQTYHTKLRWKKTPEEDNGTICEVFCVIFPSSE
jgi:hypothetical protein